MAFDPALADQLALGALSAFHNGIQQGANIINNLTHGMGLAVINVAQVGALTGAGMLLRVNDPGYMAGLRTSNTVPLADETRVAMDKVAQK